MHSNRLDRVKCHLNGCQPFMKLMDNFEHHPKSFSLTNDCRQLRNDYFINPKLAEDIQKTAVQKLAMFFYHSGLPFRAVEDPFFQEFISCLQPQFVIPSK